MRRVLPWVIAVSAFVLVIAVGVMGVKILDHDYDFIIEAHILQWSWLILIAALLIRRFTMKCPHCGKLRQPGGRFCPYCGKEIDV